MARDAELNGELFRISTAQDVVHVFAGCWRGSPITDFPLWLAGNHHQGDLDALHVQRHRPSPNPQHRISPSAIANQPR